MKQGESLEDVLERLIRQLQLLQNDSVKRGLFAAGRPQAQIATTYYQLGWKRGVESAIKLLKKGFFVEHE